MEEAAKSGFDTWVWMFKRAKQLDRGDDKSLREAREICAELLPFQAFECERKRGIDNAKCHPRSGEGELGRAVDGDIRPILSSSPPKSMRSTDGQAVSC
jgi:hypothetical protein